MSTTEPSRTQPATDTPPGFASLAEASRLLADSLDYEATLANVARLALPELGAWCIVDVVEEDGGMRRLAVIHPDPAKQALARRLSAGWPPDKDDPLGVPLVVRSRSAQVITDVGEEMLRAAAHDEDHLKTLRAMGIGSMVVVPLMARGHVHGAITFVSPDRARRYSAADVELAEDLARRAAMAIDNARLYRAAERARAQAEHASRAKSEFLATMSHEMRTPINAVVGYVDLMETELAGPVSEQQRGHLARVRAACSQLLVMVDEVLDLARVEAGRLPVAHEAAEAKDAVEEAVARARDAAADRAVRLEALCPAGPGLRYLGDEGRVGQVLDHLVGNAVKFTGAQGVVQVKCCTEGAPDAEARLAGGGPWVRIDVQDTGMGIDAEALPHVFEPFRQVDSGYTRESGGSGLGLTVARQLARLMGGDVTVRSDPGAGSCFTLWLPSAPPEGGERRARPARSVQALRVAGQVLTCEMDGVLEGYVRRLRGDPRLTHTAQATDLDLADHASTLVADVAQALLVLGADATDAPELLRDGSRIQRLVSQLHADQRYRLGWSEAELRRDFELLREEVEACIRAHLPPGDGADAAASTASRLLRQGERVSITGYRSVAGAGNE